MQHNKNFPKICGKTKLFPQIQKMTFFNFFTKSTTIQKLTI